MMIRLFYSIRNSRYHARGEKYDVSCTMDAAYFKRTLIEIGEEVRKKYAALGHSTTRVKDTTWGDPRGGCYKETKIESVGGEIKRV